MSVPFTDGDLELLLSHMDPHLIERKVLVALLARLESAEKLIRWYARYIVAENERPYKAWLRSKESLLALRGKV